MHANNSLKRVNSLSPQVIVSEKKNVVDTFRAATRVRFVTSLCSQEVVDIVVHEEVARGRLEAAVFLAELFVVVLAVSFLSFVAVQEQIGGPVRPQFCGVVDIAFIVCLVLMLFVHFLFLISLFVDALSSIPRGSQETMSGPQCIWTMLIKGYSLFVDALSSIEGELVVKLELDLTLHQGDIVGLVGSGYTPRPFLWCLVFGVLVSVFCLCGSAPGPSLILPGE